MNELRKEIRRNLSLLADKSLRTKEFVGEIIDLGYSTLPLRRDDTNHGEAHIERSSDIEYAHEEVRWPGVVIEVCNSAEKKKELSYLANDYIFETKGAVRVVIGLDIDYKHRQGSISMFRPQISTDSEGQKVWEIAEIMENDVCHLPSKGKNPELKLKYHSRWVGQSSLRPRCWPENISSGFCTCTALPGYYRVVFYPSIHALPLSQRSRGQGLWFRA